MGDAPETTNGMSRRRAIQAAAAAGVGAAVWTGPKIGVFGASPAYAGACSDGELSTTSTRTNTADGGNNACPGNSGNQGSNHYQLVTTSPTTMPVITFATTPTATTRTVSLVGTCTNGSSSISVSGTPLRCRVTLTIGGFAATPTETTGNTFVVPTVTRSQVSGSPANPSYTLSIICSTDLDDNDCV